MVQFDITNISLILHSSYFDMPLLTMDFTPSLFLFLKHMHEVKNLAFKRGHVFPPSVHCIFTVIERSESLLLNTMNIDVDVVAWSSPKNPVV